MTTFRTVLFRSIVVASFALLSPIADGGPLDPPPGPVSPTPGPEPRTVINDANTPGDADSLFRITQPGSYYLAGNISVPAARVGIEVATSDVTIDLNGFQLAGFLSQNLDGVRIESGIPRRNVIVRNGSVVQCGGVGVNFGNGIQCVVERVNAVNNSGGGITVGDGSRVESCTASQNQGLVGTAPGLAVGAGCVIRGCAAVSNSGHGITAGQASTLDHCVARGNGGTGIDTARTCTLTACSAAENALGIDVGGGCTVTACTANNNTGIGITTDDASIDDGGTTISGCSAAGNGGRGIVAFIGCSIIECSTRRNVGVGIQADFGAAITGCSSGFDSGGGIIGGTGAAITHCAVFNSGGIGISAGAATTVADCASRANSLDGIVAFNGCVIRANKSSGNGPTAAGGSGILLTGSDNRVEGNNCTGNADYGIESTAGGNLIMANSISGNTLGAFSLAANNRVAPIVSAPASGVVSGVTGAAGLGTTDPLANIVY